MAIFLFIFLLLLLIYGLVIEYYRRSWNIIPAEDLSPAKYEPSGTSDPVKVSLIIPLRNEEKHIGNLLRCISEQLYPAILLEVILVDDHSTDATWQLMLDASRKNPAVTCLRVPLLFSGKKKALETGINRASGKLVVTTDGDCSFSPEWISTIVSFYSKTGAKFIAGPVKMKNPRSFIGIFQTLDFLMLQGITGGSVYKRFHAMCNGANLAYEKEAFIDVGGFEGIQDIPSGDDMLLMHKIFTRNPDKVFYIKSRAAIVETAPESGWKKFFNQRIRWASKSVHYEDKKIFYILLLTYLVNCGFLVMAIAAIVDIYWLWFLGLLFIMKILIEFPFVNSVAIFFKQQKLMVYFPFMQPLHIIYTIVAGWLGRFGSYEWKSRIIKNKGKTKLAKL